MTDTAIRPAAVPDSPVGSRIGWVLDALSDDNETTADDVKEAFAESFLVHVPADAIAGMLNAQWMAGSAPERIDSPGQFAAVVHLVPDGEGMRFRVKISVEEELPHRISMLVAEPVWDSAAGATTRAWREVAGGDPVRESRPGANALPDELSQELEKLVADAREEQHYVGLAATVGGPDGLVWFRGFGAATADGAEVRPETVFRIGSVSKTMTAVGVMKLVEEGEIGLDDPVNDHLRSYRVEAAEGSREITIRHLLTHSSGLDPRPGVDIGCDFGQAVPDLAKFYARGLRAKRKAGESWAYSNDGFATLGHLVEELRGRPFVEVMRASLFAPLGMTSSSYLREESFEGRLVTGFNPEDDGFIETRDRDMIVRGAGGVYSTAEDMARYTACLIAGGVPVLRPETLEQMWSDQGVPLPQPGLNAHMGLGFIVHDVDGERVPWHNGGWPGAATSVYVAPDTGLAVVLTANTFGSTQAPALDRLGMQMVRRLLGQRAEA